jgi:glycosyltransferase involved in cell wall biosynthesis
MLIDVFADFTATELGFDPLTAMARLRGPDFLGHVARTLTCAVPAIDSDGRSGVADGWTVRRSAAVEACGGAIAGAADAGRPLLVLLGDVQPSIEAVGILSELLEWDSMAGFAVPRLTGTRTSAIARLDPGGDPAIDELPRRLLAEMPDIYLVADAPARCLLIKPAVLADFGELDRRFETLAGALWHLMTRARRCGFRTVVSNRAIVTAPCRTRPCAPTAISARSLTRTDRALLREAFPDVERTGREFGTTAVSASETRLARALYSCYGTRPSLLLDARNIVAAVNGTTMGALGIAGGIHAQKSQWDVMLLAPAEAAKFHHLDDLFPGWQIATTLPSRQFTAALRLSQPWHIQEMVDLHTAASFNAYFFLDSIAWDVSYLAPRNLDGTWRFMADHADALLFNSAYTRDQFRRRFPRGASVPSLVAYHSFDPADYVRPDVRMASDPDRFVFIVGNRYDHKDVEPTLELLSTAFPYESIVALGAERAPTPRVRVLESGSVSEAEINRLYAGASLVVFPSFYEGFGFPVLSTLACGGTVVARQSPLLTELAARCVPRGRIVPFARRDELVEIVGRLLHDREVASLPLGTALQDDRPMSWSDIGRNVLSFLEDLTADLSRSRWRAREHAVVQLAAAPTSLVDKGLARGTRQQLVASPA